MAGKENLIISQLSEINGHLMTISGDIGGIKQHLKDLNSKVASQEKRQNNQDESIDKLRGTVYKMVGGLSAIVLLLQIFI